MVRPEEGSFWELRGGKLQDTEAWKQKLQNCRRVLQMHESTCCPQTALCVQLHIFISFIILPIPRDGISESLSHPPKGDREILVLGNISKELRRIEQATLP